jgi:hypothetical protein
LNHITFHHELLRRRSAKGTARARGGRCWNDARNRDAHRPRQHQHSGVPSESICSGAPAPEHGGVAV